MSKHAYVEAQYKKWRKRNLVDCASCGIVHYQECAHWDYEGQGSVDVRDVK